MVERKEKLMLSHVFNKLFAYLITLKRNCATTQPSYMEVRKNILDMLEQSAWIIREKGIDPRDYDDARFAVCVWVDETLLNLPWVHKTEWQRAMLQIELYNNTRGGDEFFERLNQLSPAQNSVREIYYTCLALGFMGRYCHDGDEMLLQQLKKSTLGLLVGDATGVAAYSKRALFPEAYQTAMNAGAKQDDKHGLRFGQAKVWLISTPPAVLFVIYIVYAFVLNGVADNLMARVVGG